MTRYVKYILIPILIITLISALTGCVDQTGYPLDINGGEPGQPLRIYVEGGIGLGTGNVTANNNLTDDALTRGDGGILGIQTSTATLSDGGVLYTPGDINTDSDVNAGNDVNVTNDLDVGDDTVIHGGLTVTDNATFTNNVTANAFFGDGSNLTGIAGTGNVTSSANLTDNTIIKGDGGALGVQDSGVTISDTDNVTTTGNITATSFFGDGTTLTGIATLNGTQELDNKTLDSSVGKGTWTASGTWTLPAITFGGMVTVSENVTILLSDSLSADGAYCGIVEAGVAGTTLAFGDLVYLAVADGRWELADADAEATTKPKLGICVLAAANDGTATRILLFGKVRADANFPSLTVGSPVWVSTAVGDIQATAPNASGDFVRIIGYANTENELFFNPDQTWIELA
jgi:hypothetical protein